MNKILKIILFVLATWLIIIIISKFAFKIVHINIPTYSNDDAQSVIWAWACLFMGLVLARILKKWLELLWGILAFVFCLFPAVGVLVGILYFLRGYKLLLSKETK